MRHDHIWQSCSGEKVTCIEKLKVMQQNLDELKQVAQDAFEDGILMGIDPLQLKESFIQLMQNLHNPYN